MLTKKSHAICHACENNYIPVGILTRDYQKVRWLIRWHQYSLSYAYKFCKEFETTHVLSVVKM